MVKFKKVQSMLFIAVFSFFTVLNLMPNNIYAATNKKNMVAKIQIVPSGFKSSYYVGDKAVFNIISRNCKTVQYKIVILNNEKKLYKDITRGYTKSISSIKPYTISIPTTRVGKYYINISAKKAGNKDYEALWKGSYIIKEKSKNSTVTKENKQEDKEKIQGIKEAIEAIEKLPEAKVIVLGDKAKVVEARTKVELAKKRGAVDADITNLSKLVECEAKIVELEKSSTSTTAGGGGGTSTTAGGGGGTSTTPDSKALAIQEANKALAEIPEVDKITKDNLVDVKAKVTDAESKVKEAKTKGAIDSDFKGLDRLIAAKNKIRLLENTSNGMKVSVKAEGNKVIISVTNDLILDDAVSIIIFDKETSNIFFISNSSLKDGKVDFESILKNGVYYAKITGVFGGVFITDDIVVKVP